MRCCIEDCNGFTGNCDLDFISHFYLWNYWLQSVWSSFSTRIESRLLWNILFYVEFLLLSLFVLLSADNFMDLLEPAYKISPWYSLYFITFIILGSYLVLPLVLAVVVEAYKDNHKTVVQKDRIKERRAVSEAFFLLAGSEGGKITEDIWKKFMKLRDPKISENQVRYLFNAIDTDASGELDILEFFELCDVLQLEFQYVSALECSNSFSARI